MRRIFTLALLLVPLSAQAQFGSLMKAAKKKAAETAVEKAAGKVADKAATKAADAGLGAQPKFDEVLLELDETRLTAVIKGLATEQNLRTRGDLAGKLRAAAALDSSSRETSDKTREARDQWEDSRSRVESCINKIMDEKSEAHGALMQQKMAQMVLDAQAQAVAGKTPAIAQKLTAVQTEMMQAYAKGDTGTATRKQGEMYKLLGVDLAADSAAARSKCGKLPAKPAEVERAEKLSAAAEAAATAARDLEQKSGEAAAKVAGLTLPQFAMARERLEMWVASKGKGGAYSAPERASLKVHLDEFTPLIKQ